MKLLYNILFLLGVVQLGLTNSLENSSASSNSTQSTKTLEQFTKYYNQELNLLAQDICVKLYNISKQILKDKTIQEAKTSVIKEFKENVTEFQDLYTIYRRYQMQDELLALFADALTAVNDTYQKNGDNKDAQFILELLKQHGYEEIMEEYKIKYMKFISGNYVPKLEELKTHNAQNQTQKLKTLFKWGEEIKKCKKYECFYNNFQKLEENILTPKEQFLEYVDDKIKQLSLYYGRNAYGIVKNVLKNEKLQQLPDKLKQKLLHNINEFISTYENSSNIYNFYDSLDIYDQNIVIPYLDEDESQLSPKLVKTIRNIFDEYDFEQFEKKYEKKMNEFLENGLVEKFENFKATLSKEELSKEKPLLVWFKHFKTLSSTWDKNSALDVLYAITE